MIFVFLSCRLFLFTIIAIWSSFLYAQDDSQDLFKEVVYVQGDFTLKGYLCKPPGDGQFAAVIYNHGGKGENIGGSPKETCVQLAQEGFIGFSPIRRPTISMQGHMDDVWQAVDYLKTFEFVDTTRLAMMGFSRGGHLTLKIAARSSEFKAIVLMAPAPGGGNVQHFVDQAQVIDSPVLLLAAENDNKQYDHLGLIKEIERQMRLAGKDVKLIVYPPFGEDGHLMFFEVNYYWRDIVKFLNEHLK